MQVDLGRNESIVTTYPAPAYMKSRVVSMGPNNYVNFTAYIRTLIDMSGTPTKSLTIAAEGSNDGVNWVAITGLSVTSTVTGLATAEGDLGFAWLRFDINLTLAGSAGDTAEAVFDLQANVLRK